MVPSKVQIWHEDQKREGRKRREREKKTNDKKKEKKINISLRKEILSLSIFAFLFLSFASNSLAGSGRRKKEGKERKEIARGRRRELQKDNDKRDKPITEGRQWECARGLKKCELGFQTLGFLG